VAVVCVGAGLEAAGGKGYLISSFWSDILRIARSEQTLTYPPVVEPLMLFNVVN
jgi:hypothetical protein